MNHNIVHIFISPTPGSSFGYQLNWALQCKGKYTQNVRLIAKIGLRNQSTTKDGVSGGGDGGDTVNSRILGPLCLAKLMGGSQPGFRL